MRVLIAGAGGQIGRALAGTASPDSEVRALTRVQLDLTSPAAAMRVVGDFRPDFVMNAAGYTAVDRAEAEPEAAHAVNEAGARNLAEAVARVGSRMLHFSTDYVFDGARARPYAPADPPNPLNAYGMSKLAGERAVLDTLGDQAVVVRTAWVYTATGRNFLRTMLRLLNEPEQISVVSDQVGTPTCARSVALAAWAMAGRPDVHGIAHWTDDGVASWYDFAVATGRRRWSLAWCGGQRPFSRSAPRTIRLPPAALAIACWTARQLARRCVWCPTTGGSRYGAPSGILLMSSADVVALARISRGTPAQVLVVLYIVLAIANSLVTTSLPRRLLVVVGVLLIVYEALGFRSMRHEQYFLYLIGAWIATAVTLNGVFFGEWVQESVYLPGNIGVALALCRGHLGRRATTILFYGAAAYLGYRLLSARTPGAIHQVLTSGSANGISELMIILCGLHYVVSRHEGAPIRVMPAVACLFVSSLALGRAGMGAAAFLLVGVALRDLIVERRRRLLIVKSLAYASVALAVLVVVLPRLELISFVFERFSEFGLGSEGRDRIWGAYGESLGGIAALIGHGREELFAGYSNVHSSYILWHKSMGLMAIPLYLLAALAVVRALMRDWVLFIVLAALLLRSSFDEMTLPFRLYDFLFYYLVCTLLVTLPPLRRPQGLPRPAEA